MAPDRPDRPDPDLDPHLCHRSAAVVDTIPDVKAGLALRAFSCLVSGVRLGRYEGSLEVGRHEVEGVMAVLDPHGPEVITPKGSRLLGGCSRRA